MTDEEFAREVLRSVRATLGALDLMIGQMDEHPGRDTTLLRAASAGLQEAVAEEHPAKIVAGLIALGVVLPTFGGPGPQQETLQ